MMYINYMRYAGAIILLCSVGCALDRRIEVQESVYVSPTGAHQVLYALPPGVEPRPAFVFMHWGGWAGGDPAFYREWLRLLAERGYPAFSIAYTLGDANHPVLDRPLEDLAAALEWVRRQRGVRRRAIFLVGESAGGHLVLMHALLRGDVAGVLAVSPVTDVAGLWGQREYVRCLADCRDRAVELSPISHLRGDAPPIAVIHGCTDDVVPVDQVDEFVQAMLRAGAPVEYHRLYRGSHAPLFLHPEIYLPMVEDFAARVLTARPSDH